MEDRMKTKRALARVAAGSSAYAAALAEGIAPPTVYRAQKREREKAEKAGRIVVCPCCDSRVEKLLLSDHVVQQLRDIRADK